MDYLIQMLPPLWEGAQMTLKLFAITLLLSIPLGFVAGNGLALFFANGMRSDFYRIPVALPPSAYAFSALVTILSAIVSGLAVYWRIRQLDLIGVLKTRE